jgi:hypothetical protein
MMAASMKGDKRNKSTTKAPAPPRRSARIENKFLWDRLRNTEDVMRHVYSFLSFYDRVHLTEVDRTFRDDEDRVTVVASYGDDGLDLLEAFEKIKKRQDYEMSLDYQMEMNTFYRGGEIEVRAEWYTPEGGWDLERIMVRRMFFLMHHGGLLLDHSFENAHTIHPYRMKVISVVMPTTRKSSFRSTPS